MDELRLAGQRIADSYDALPYETPADPLLRPGALLGFGAVFGCAGASGDVLDLGCGTGMQLEGAADEMAGRLVGVDLSRANCARATARLTRFGSRATIHHADLLDLTPEALGRFDLIYAVGLVFAVPPPVRAQALHLIGCLKPGGVALISHYGGAISAARSELHRLVRGAIAPDLPPAEAIAQGRAALTRLEPQMPEAARLTASLPDSTFFHEVFNPFCGPVTVGAMDQALAGDGVRFLAHVEAPASGQPPEPRARAEDADARDRQGGGYHYALFGKDARAPDLAAPSLAWSTKLRRLDILLYRIGETERTVQIAHAPTRAALDAIAKAPLPFLQAAPEEERDVTLQMFRDLWAARLVTPLRRD